MPLTLIQAQDQLHREILLILMVGYTYHHTQNKSF